MPRDGVRRMARLLLAVSLVPLTGCGPLPGHSTASGSGPASGLSENFRLVKEAKGLRVVGHGISFIVPADWRESEPEADNGDSPGVREWAVEPTKQVDPFAPYIDVTASAADVDKGNVDDSLQAFKGLQGIDASFKVLDEGTVKVPGSTKAYQVHFRYHERTTFGSDPAERDVDVETRLILVGLPGGHVTTLRQIAVLGQFRDVDFDAMLASVRVHLR